MTSDTLRRLNILLSNKNVKIIIWSITIGGTLQFLAIKYLEKHPELLDDKQPQNTGRDTTTNVPYGGFLIGEATKIFGLSLVKVFASNGIIIALAAGGG